MKADILTQRVKNIPCSLVIRIQIERNAVKSGWIYTYYNIVAALYKNLIILKRILIKI